MIQNTIQASDEPNQTAVKKDNSFWQKLAVAGASGLATLGAAKAMPAPVPQQEASPFLNAYISARKNALKSQIGG